MDAYIFDGMRTPIGSYLGIHNQGSCASLELAQRQGRYALCTLCVGVGQGVAMIIERI